MLHTCTGTLINVLHQLFLRELSEQLQLFLMDSAGTGAHFHPLANAAPAALTDRKQPCKLADLTSIIHE